MRQKLLSADVDTLFASPGTWITSGRRLPSILRELSG
jgi:hypothetical protein